MRSISTIAAILLVASSLFAQQQEPGNTSFSIGLGGGLTYAEYGYSRFGFRIGPVLAYRWNDYSIQAEYSRLSVLDLKEPGSTSNYGQSRFLRAELSFGIVLLDFRRFLFLRDIQLSTTAGVSWSNIRYFADVHAVWQNITSTKKAFGIPLGIQLGSSFSESVNSGVIYRYHIVEHHPPFGDIGAFITIAVM